MGEVLSSCNGATVTLVFADSNGDLQEVVVTTLDRSITISTLNADGTVKASIVIPPNTTTTRAINASQRVRRVLWQSTQGDGTVVTKVALPHRVEW